MFALGWDLLFEFSVLTVVVFDADVWWWFVGLNLLWSGFVLYFDLGLVARFGYSVLCLFVVLLRLLFWYFGLLLFCVCLVFVGLLLCVILFVWLGFVGFGVRWILSYLCLIVNCFACWLVLVLNVGDSVLFCGLLVLGALLDVCYSLFVACVYVIVCFSCLLSVDVMVVIVCAWVYINSVVWIWFVICIVVGWFLMFVCDCLLCLGLIVLSGGLSWLVLILLNLTVLCLRWTDVLLLF